MTHFMARQPISDCGVETRMVHDSPTFACSIISIHCKINIETNARLFADALMQTELKSPSHVSFTPK